MTFMHNLYSVSKQIIVLFLIFICISSLHAADRDIPSPVYRKLSVLPKDSDNKADCKWAAYFIRQAQNRVNDKTWITGQQEKDKQTTCLYIHIDPSSGFDYEISTEKEGEIYLTASSESTMLWLIYQWIAKTAETDTRWNATDLDPAIITLEHEQKNFDFKYRSIYSSAINDPDKIAINADQHVDYHWGLWGHNIRKIFTGKNIPQDALALVNGKRNPEQFCFSSESLYKALSEYITDTYGNGEDGNTGWFAILPDDNLYVCQCEQCRKAGNNKQSATPAVTSMLTRLAARFPHHHFYTSAYLTTVQAPQKELPQNAGVIISAIDLPLSTSLFQTEAYRNWNEKFNQWKHVTNRIIIWDYMRNFDDYLTPYPCLESIRQRLKWFKQLGVYGMFYNGSGDDYASFDDVQTYVISALLKNTEINISEYVKKYFRHYYPNSWETLFNYYNGLEKYVEQNHIQLEWYAGINTAIKTYFDTKQFRDFYSRLDKISKSCKEEERGRLNQLLTALNFTQLEIIRSGITPAYSLSAFSDNTSKDFLVSLKGHSHLQHMQKYKEANGDLDEYIHDWEYSNIYQHHPDNLIFNKNIGDNQQLTDGYHGFPHDYHLHWQISEKRETTLPVHQVFESRKLSIQLSFLNAPVWKIGIPSRIEIYQGNKLKGIWTANSLSYSDFQIIKVKTEITSSPEEGILIIKIIGGEQPKTACDEIEIYPTNK